MSNHKRFNVIKKDNKYRLCDRIKISVNEMRHNVLFEGKTIGEVWNYLKEKHNANKHYRRRKQWVVIFNE